MNRLIRNVGNVSSLTSASMENKLPFRTIIPSDKSRTGVNVVFDLNRSSAVNSRHR